MANCRAYRKPMAVPGYLWEASKPEETGKFFAWGDTSPKEWYDWQHYQWYDDGNNIIKYNTLAKWGQVDNLTALTTGPDGDDAVSATVGGKWRMPTDDELYEIAAYSTSTDIQWTWTEDYNGTKVNGFIVSSGKEEYAGNSIFLPVAGRYEGNQYLEKGTSAGYWSSSLNTPLSISSGISHLSSASKSAFH